MLTYEYAFDFGTQLCFHLFRIFLCLFSMRQFWHLEDCIVETFWCLMTMLTGTRPTDIKHIDSISCGPMADWGQGTGEWYPLVPCGKLGTNTQTLLANTQDLRQAELNKKDNTCISEFSVTDFFCIEKWWTFKLLYYFFFLFTCISKYKSIHKWLIMICWFPFLVYFLNWISILYGVICKC